MKSILFALSILMTGAAGSTITGSDMEAISKAVTAFATHADNQDVPKMATVLHKDFRAVVNRLFGSEEVALMDKSLYLDLLKQGKIGGAKRTVRIHSIDIEENNAIVRATFQGEQMTFNTFIQLVKDVQGHWTIIGDMPRIEQR
ncbi:MAG: nuclear transport factor 2 family protein [Bacteroidota bacterium]